jgi:hypothetical protein
MWDVDFFMKKACILAVERSKCHDLELGFTIDNESIVFGRLMWDVDIFHEEGMHFGSRNF